jgi:hypothetical protein
MKNVVKTALVIASLVAAVMWVHNPDGNFEPLIVLLAAILAAIVHFSPIPAPSALTIDGQPFEFDLSIGWNERSQSSELTAWLEWRTRLTPLIARETEQTELREWANSSPSLSFKVIQAEGGVGKTRLAAELAQSLIDTKRWNGGFVNLASFERAQRLAWQGNTIVVVDYPEHSPERLAQLIAAAKEGIKTDKKHKLRILLLCRSQQGVNDLLNKQGAQSYATKPLVLRELAGKCNLNLLNQSLTKLAPQAASVSQVEFEVWLAQSELHKTALFVIALAIHLSTAPTASNRFLPGAQLLQALLVREQARWAKAEEGHGLSPGLLTDVLAFATLFDGLSQQTINTSIIDAYRWPSNEVGKLHSALAEVWPLDKSSQTHPSMAPDLLAAVLLWQWQSQPVKQGMQRDARLLATLSPSEPAGFARLLQRWHMQAYDQTTRLQLGLPGAAPALAALLHKAAETDEVFTEKLKRAFQKSTSWTALADLAVATGKPKTDAPSESASQEALATRAMELNNHAVDLASAGDRASALKAAQEAVDIRRRLATTSPAAYEPDLAMSISNLANRLSDTGDRPGALKAAQEAVDIRRRLATTSPAAYEPYLATSISNFASFLSETGDRPGALKAAQEAVDIYRRLAAISPAAYEPDLAMSINNLAGCLSETGDRPGALKAAREAVALYEKAQRIAPGAFDRQLAIAKRVRDKLE